MPKNTSYFHCDSCHHVWRSSSAASMAERQLCKHCQFPVVPFGSERRWQFDHYAKVQSSSTGQLELQIFFDPALLHHGLAEKVMLSQFDEGCQRERLQRRKKWLQMADCKGKAKGKGKYKGYWLDFDFNAPEIDHASIIISDEKVQEEIKENLKEFLHHHAPPVSLFCRGTYELATVHDTPRFWCANSACKMRACTRVESACLKIRLDVPLPPCGMRLLLEWWNNFAVEDPCASAASLNRDWHYGAAEAGFVAAKDFLLVLRKTVSWGKLLTYQSHGEHLMANCQACAFYGRSCRMKIDHCGSYSTMLKLSDVGEEATEEYLRHALDNAMLKGSRVKQVLLGLKPDIDDFLAAIEKQKNKCVAAGEDYDSDALPPPLSGQERETEIDVLKGKIRQGESRFQQQQIVIKEMKKQLKWLKDQLRENIREGQPEQSQLKRQIAEVSWYLAEASASCTFARMAVVEFDNAEIARSAILNLHEISRLQKSFENRAHSVLEVGLMKKEWLNWKSILFLQELLLRPSGDGPVRSAVRAVIQKHCFGQVMREDHRVRVVMISLPHWLRAAVKAIKDLSAILGTFEIIEDPYCTGIQQIVNPKHVLDFGYVTVGSEDSVRLAHSGDTAPSVGVSGGDCKTQLCPKGGDRCSNASSTTKSSVLALQVPEHEPASLPFLEEVEELCGIINLEGFKKYLIKWWGKEFSTPSPDTFAPLHAFGTISSRHNVEVDEESSAISLNSIDFQASAPSSFTFDTLFKSASDTLIPVQHLDVGHRICSADGRLLDVVGTSLRQSSQVRLVTIQTESASIVVTSSNRQVTTCGEKLAGDVQVGDHIPIYAASTGDLTHEEVMRVWSSDETTDVYEITFKPDLPVACFNQPAKQALSLGHASTQTHNANAHVRRTRRGRNPHRSTHIAPVQPAESVPSIPDTFHSWL